MKNNNIMNPLFKLPLHGVFNTPFCGSPTEAYPLNITLNFEKIDFDSALKPLWALIDEGKRYSSEITLYKVTEASAISYYLKINCQGNGLFKITDDLISIDWQTGGTDAAHYFQTVGLALYLELNHILCLHANALAFKDKAIAIVAPSRTGKTTLTAALNQKGFSLMTDDMIALHQSHGSYKIFPSWPVARMWPDALNEIESNSREISQHKKVHEKFDKCIVSIDENSSLNFCNEPKNLTVIYLLNRLPHENEINGGLTCELLPVKKARGLMLLLQNSILGSSYRALDLEMSRVQALSALVDNIAFKQINYISGTEHLNDVCELIKNDVKG